MLQAPTWKTANIDHVLLTKASDGVHVCVWGGTRTDAEVEERLHCVGMDAYLPSPHPSQAATLTGAPTSSPLIPPPPQVFRQADGEFVRILDDIRYGRNTQQVRGWGEPEGWMGGGG